MNEPKSRKCIICRKRYVRQQEWKTEREKEICLTCKIVDDCINTSLLALHELARRKGLRLKASTALEPLEPFNE